MIQLNRIDNSRGRMGIYDILIDLPSYPACHTSSLSSQTFLTAVKNVTHQY